MRTVRLCAALGAVLVGIGGCDSSDEVSGVPLSELPERLVSVYCEVFTDCLGAAADLYFAGADCEEQLGKQIQDSELPLIEDAVERGDAMYDGAKAAECLADLERRGCDLFVTRVSTACEEALHGNRAGGEDCTLDAECDVGLFCKTASTCPGACSPLLGAGESCADSDECDDGLICSDDTAECIAPVGEGEACEAGQPPCLPNLVCQGATESSSGTCVTIDDVYSGDDGDPCDFEEPSFCKPGLACAFLSDSEARCEAPPAAGDPCHIAIPEECAAGSYCVVAASAGAALEGTCEPNPRDGQPCGGRYEGDPDPTACDLDHVCYLGTCRALARLGEACPTDEACYSGVCADGECAPSLCAE